MKPLSNLRITLFLFVSLMFGLGSVYGQAEEHGFIEGVNYQKNVVYKTVDGRNLIVDIFYPDSVKMQDENPWVLFIHGGGWAGGTRNDIFKKCLVGTLKELVDNGVICATVKYRKARAPITTYESVIDCKDATRFLLKNAEKFKLDKEKYGVWGASAGGHMCLVTALVPDVHFPGDPALADIHPDYKCVLSFFPFTSCLNPDIRPESIFADCTLFPRLLGGTLEEKPELAKWLSPTEYLKKDSSPILLVHGDNDTTLPIINSYYMMEVAEEVDADVELLVVKGGGHSFSGKRISPSFEELADSCCSYMLTKLGVEKIADK